MQQFNSMWDRVKSENTDISGKALDEIRACGYGNTFSDMVMECIDQQTPFSFVRLGDGELVILSQLYRTANEINGQYGWSSSLGYCGANVPSMDLCNRMVESVKQSTFVGIFGNDPFNEAVFNAMNYHPARTCHAFDNLYLPMRKDFVDILRKYPPLMIGRKANDYASYLKKELDIDIPACIGIESYKEIDTVIDRAMQIQDKWKWAFVCAGVPAVVIAGELNYKHGKVALDMGHALDNILAGWVDYWICKE